MLLKHSHLFNGQGGEFPPGDRPPGRIGPKTTAEILALVKLANVFVIDAEAMEAVAGEGQRWHPAEVLDRLPLALPFKVCWFECVTNRGELSSLYMGTRPREGRRSSWQSWAFW